jgi:hypothetical protein
MEDSFTRRGSLRVAARAAVAAEEAVSAAEGQAKHLRQVA